MQVRPKSFRYTSTVRWSEHKKGELSASDKPDIQVATPPEFKGHEGIWSPEDLFVASANVCLMTTFLAFAERTGLSFAGYESRAEGLLEMVDGKFQFTKIVLRPTVRLKQREDAQKAEQVLAKAEDHCLISNSMKAQVILEPTVV